MIKKAEKGIKTKNPEALEWELWKLQQEVE